MVGLAPALTMVRGNLRLSSAEGGRANSTGPGARGVRRGLVVAEFALAIILLTGSGLLVRSWMSLTSVDPGFVPDGLLSMNISTSAYESGARRVNFYEDVLDQVESIPGVEAAGMIGDLFTDGHAELTFTAEGAERETPARITVRIDEVSDDLFTTLETPLLGGRVFSDEAESPPVAIVNRTMAERLFPGADPVGRRFKRGDRESDAPWITIVGQVADMRRQGIETEPIPQIFRPLAQEPSGSEILLVRTTTRDPLDMAAAVLAAVRRVDSQVPIYFLTSVEAQMGSDLTQRRFQTSMLIGFSLVALLMAAVGIYGLIHYSVAARRREFAIRMAVGAPAGDIFGRTIGEGLRLSGLGLVLGLAGALVLGRVASGLLFGVAAGDPLTLGAVSLLLVIVAAAACYFPARRSMNVDPIVALRPD
jgi:predicted permease